MVVPPEKVAVPSPAVAPGAAVTVAVTSPAGGGLHPATPSPADRLSKATITSISHLLFLRFLPYSRLTNASGRNNAPVGSNGR
ncbi:MAG TPA: hypothetical protein PLV64_13025 [Anaerolineales bacterium]|nr:hypothetical protein [Anaerolineales bacterium]